MTAMYGNNFMSLENVYKWVAQLADNSASQDEFGNSSHPHTSVAPANSALVESMIQEDCCGTLKSIAMALDML